MHARHNLVWLTEAGWRDVHACASDEWHTAVTQWQRNDWPLTVRRADPDAQVDKLCIGLAQAPDSNGIKKRLPLRIDPAKVQRATEPLPLAAALSSAPETWRHALAALDAAAEKEGIRLRVYGSLSLQTLTGLPYLKPGSDIDVLFQPDTRQQLSSGIGLLSRYASCLPLDGEVIFPRGEAVAWKEWANAMGMRAGLRVLVKGLKDVHLATPEELRAQLRNADA